MKIKNAVFILIMFVLISKLSATDQWRVFGPGNPVSIKSKYSSPPFCKWHKTNIGYKKESYPSGLGFLIDNSFDTWEDCGYFNFSSGSDIKIYLVSGENGWIGYGPITYSQSTGEITSAMIKLNGGTFDGRIVNWTDGIEDFSYANEEWYCDVQNAVTHEIGHNLGIAHHSTGNGEPTMATRRQCPDFYTTLKRRSLETDDWDALNFLYKNSFVPSEFSTINEGINAAIPVQTVYVSSGTYVENVDIDQNITIEGSGSPTIRGHTEISGTSATLKYLNLEPGSSSGSALGIYNGTATVQSCYIKKGPNTGLWGIWCSNSTLKLRYGSIFAQSTSTNTSIFLINAGSSSYIRDCMIKPGNGIAIDGTADGYAQDCDIVTYYKDSGYDINAYFADAGTFDLISNNYGSAQSIYDPYPYNVSGDGWPPGLAKPVLIANSNSSNSAIGDLDSLLNQADSLIAQGKFDQGTDILKSIISNYPDEPAAVFALHKLVSYRNERDIEEGKNNYAIENQSDLAGLQRKFSDNHPLKLKAQEYEINNDVRLGNVDEAINESFAFSEKYADLENGRRVLLGIADIYHFVTKDEDAEKKIYELFLEKYPDHPMSEYVKLKLQDQPLTPAMNPETEPSFSIYPNPFNLETQIRFRNYERTVVNINIYNSMGQRIKQLVNKSLPEGLHTVVWNGKNETGDVVASGLYFCSLKTDKNIFTQKLLLVK